MRLSRDEALSLLDKWRIESTPVSGAIMLCDVTTVFSGLICETSPRGFKIAQPAKPGEATQLHFEITIPLAIVEDYEYRDLREAPEEDRSKLAQIIVSQLLIKLHHFGNCSIFERVS